MPDITVNKIIHFNGRKGKDFTEFIRNEFSPQCHPDNSLQEIIRSWHLRQTWKKSDNEHFAKTHINIKYSKLVREKYLKILQDYARKDDTILAVQVDDRW